MLTSLIGVLIYWGNCMRVGLDLDGTVVNTPIAMIEYINERLSLNLTINDIKTYRIEDALPEQYRWIVENGFRDSIFWKKVELIEGAYENIKKLYEENKELYFVTSSLPLNLKKKIGHLTRNLDFFPKDYVWRRTINIHEKQRLDLDILVDDALYNLIGDRLYYSICVDMPYNQTNEIIPNFTRAKDWDEIYDKIHMIEELIK